MVKTTLTAENAVEANKLSNNYKVGGGTHGCSWRAVMGFNFLPLHSSPKKTPLSAVWLQEMEEPRDSAALGGSIGDCQGALLRPQRHPRLWGWVALGSALAGDSVDLGSCG